MNLRRPLQGLFLVALLSWALSSTKGFANTSIQELDPELDTYDLRVKKAALLPKPHTVWEAYVLSLNAGRTTDTVALSTTSANNGTLGLHYRTLLEENYSFADLELFLQGGLSRKDNGVSKKVAALRDFRFLGGIQSPIFYEACGFYAGFGGRGDAVMDWRNRTVVGMLAEGGLRCTPMHNLYFYLSPVAEWSRGTEEYGTTLGSALGGRMAWYWLPGRLSVLVETLKTVGGVESGGNLVRWRMAADARISQKLRAILDFESRSTVPNSTRTTVTWKSFVIGAGLEF